MALGDIINFGTIFTKNKNSNMITQHTAESTAENISMYTIGDTFNDKYTRQWVEASVNSKTIYINLNFTAINNDLNALLKLHNQSDYIDKEEYRTVLLTEEEWKSIPSEIIEKIKWNEYPDMYVITNSMHEEKIVWLRYSNGVWTERLWGSPDDINSTLYINGFISVLCKGSTAWNAEELGYKLYDMGPQHKPFGVRYKISDSDNQSITVTERINGDIIRVIEDFDKKQYGIVKIDKDIFDSLELITQNTIEVEATDGIHSDIYYMTFRKVNSSPYISGTFADLGIIENKPSIKYSVSDPDGDKITVIETINGVQIRSFTATPDVEYTAYISNDFWNNCGSSKNTLEIYAVDTFGATYKVQSTFEKALADTTYTVFYAVEGDLLYERVFESIDGVLERRGYTYTYDTKNRSMDFDLSGIEEGTEVKVWVVTHNSYASENYKTSNVLTFKKRSYGKPIVNSSTAGNILTQYESEYGEITIRYDHEDVEYVGGVLVSKDTSREISDYEGQIEIHYYIDGKYGGMYPLTNDIINVGETKKYTMDFEVICPGSRCHEITYFIRILDKQTGMYNSNKKPNAVNASDLLPGSHYFNDEPADPVIRQAYLESFGGNKLVYGFDYINIYWDSLIDNDGDHSIYYMYLRTPIALNEDIYIESIPSRRGPTTVEYNRQYRIIEKRDDSGVVVGCVVSYYDGVSFVDIQDNDFLGITIQYKDDHLGRDWPEKEEYSFVIKAQDERPWDNSYYGLYISSDNDYVYSRRHHTYPNEVKLTILPNLVDSLSDGEKGRVTILYTHPEITDVVGTVDLYAYQDGQLIAKVYSGEFYPGEEQTITIDFTMYESGMVNETEKTLKRSKDVTYYAVATDDLGFSSLNKFQGMALEYIPYLEPDEEGKYDYYIVSADGITFNFNNMTTFSYEGPVQVGKHYFNEEPPAVTPEEYDPTVIGYDSIEIKWPHIADPDGDEVKYEIYVANSVDYFNVEEKEFFSDNHPDSEDYIEDSNNERAIVSTLLKYHRVIEIPASIAEESSKRFEISVKEYLEDSDINLWIVSKDPYVNSYYRSGEIINLAKGHSAKEIRVAYPRNDSTIYAKTPRLLIYLGEDNLEQTVYVQWLEEIYNNREHPEHFSSTPNKNNIIIFKPPVPYTGVSGNKVTFSVWVHNRCSYGDKTYVTYTYRDFFDSLSDDKLIPIKSTHVNLFREAINKTRDAYGLDQVKFTRDIRKDMIFENFDFNETKQAIMEVNNKINNADPGEGLDYVNPLIVDVKDLDPVEYEGTIGATSYEEFLEWARLLYILENL